MAGNGEVEDDDQWYLNYARDSAQSFEDPAVTLKAKEKVAPPFSFYSRFYR